MIRRCGGDNYGNATGETGKFELDLLKDKAFQQRLGGFSHWEQENSPAETDLAALEDDIEA